MWRGRNTIAVPLVIAAVVFVTTSCSSQADSRHVNGRTLLTYAAGSARANALLQGALHTNPAGCLAVGKLVLVVPRGSELKPDGSIVVDGTSYRFGSPVRLGGGRGNAPRGSSCGKNADYWYV